MTHRTFHISVATMLQAVLLSLAVALVGVLSRDIDSGWDEVASAGRLARLSEIDREVFGAMQAARLHRGTIQTRLLSQDAPLADITAIRAGADAAVSGALAAARDGDIAGAPEMLRETSDRIAAAAERWQDIVALAAAPKADRMLQRTEGWYRAVGDVVDRLAALSVLTAGEVRMSDAEGGEFVTIRQLAWRFRAVAGDECSMVRGAVAAGAPLTQPMRARIDTVRGAQSQALAALDDLLARPGAAAPLVAATTAASAHFRESRIARDLVYQRLDQPGAERASADAWTELCNKPLAPILGIATAAIQLTNLHAAARLASARWRLAKGGALLIASICVSAWAAWLVRWRFMRPIARLTADIDRFLVRDFSRPVADAAREDEFATMGRTLEMLRVGAVDAERLARDHGISQQAALGRSAALEVICHRFEGMSGETLHVVGDAIEAMTGSAGSMAAATRAAGDETATLAEAVRSTISHVTAVATSVSMMQTTMSAVAAQVDRSAIVSREAVRDATTTTQGVAKLSDAAVEIGTVVNAISAIAAQTNLLALNATIEAARAGEAGKGFAVVASEVKALANQTSLATRQIDQRVKQIQQATGEAVTAIDGIGRRIGDIDRIVAAIALTVRQQDAAIGQLAHDAAAVSESSADVSARLSGLRDAAGQTAEEAALFRVRASDAADQSQSLANQIHCFVAEVGALRNAA